MSQPCLCHKTSIITTKQNSSESFQVGEHADLPIFREGGMPTEDRDALGHSLYPVSCPLQLFWPFLGYILRNILVNIRKLFS